MSGNFDVLWVVMLCAHITQTLVGSCTVAHEQPVLVYSQHQPSTLTALVYQTLAGCWQLADRAMFVHGYTDIRVPHVSKQCLLTSQVHTDRAFFMGCAVRWLGEKREGTTLFP